MAVSVSGPANRDCPLCDASAPWRAEAGSRTFFQCPACGLLFADPASHLDPAAEKAIYDLHRNDPADIRYRRFLNRLAAPLLMRLQCGMQGLDYGCGPGPTLSIMLEEAGMAMCNYDPIYAPDAALLARQYDFVTCSEVVEHFCAPLPAWQQLADLLRPGGLLAVMTQFVPACEAFAGWRYKDDPTHVSFYSWQTFRWLAARFDLDLQWESAADGVALLQKKAR